MFLMYFNILDLSLDRIAFVKKMGYIFYNNPFCRKRTAERR